MPDIIDTRDLQKRLNELEDLESTFKEMEEKYEEALLALNTHIATVRPIGKRAGSKWDKEQESLEESLSEARAELDSATSDLEEDELKELREIESEVPEFRSGNTLINDNYFETYAEQFAGDIGAIDPKANWPLTHIDWSAAADELKLDYSSIDYDGDTYWYRQ